MNCWLGKRGMTPVRPIAQLESGRLQIGASYCHFGGEHQNPLLASTLRNGVDVMPKTSHTGSKGKGMRRPRPSRHLHRRVLRVLDTCTLRPTFSSSTEHSRNSMTGRRLAGPVTPRRTETIRV